MVIKRNGKVIRQFSLKPLIWVAVILVAAFFAINFRLTLACFVNVFRFVSFSAYNYGVIYDEVYKQIDEEKTDIQVKASTSTLQRIAHEFLGSCPELFHVRGISYTEGSEYHTLHMDYWITGEDRQAAKTEYEAMLDEIAKSVDKDASKAEKVLYIHDYIVDNFSYSTEYHDAYNMMKHKKGACTSYSQLFKALMQRCDIDCAVVWSTVYNHSWNVVKIGGLWYQTDVTWDDTSEGKSYKYFLVTDNEVSDSGHGQWMNCGKYRIACFSPIYMIKYKNLRDK